jgi:hypothetical protein
MFLYLTVIAKFRHLSSAHGRIYFSIFGIEDNVIWIWSKPVQFTDNLIEAITMLVVREVIWNTHLWSNFF